MEIFGLAAFISVCLYVTKRIFIVSHSIYLSHKSCHKYLLLCIYRDTLLSHFACLY